MALPPEFPGDGMTASSYSQSRGPSTIQMVCKLSRGRLITNTPFCQSGVFLFILTCGLQSPLEGIRVWGNGMNLAGYKDSDEVGRLIARHFEAEGRADQGFGQYIGHSSIVELIDHF